MLEHAMAKIHDLVRESCKTGDVAELEAFLMPEKPGKPGKLSSFLWSATTKNNELESWSGDDNQQTPLMIAAAAGNIKVINFLIKSIEALKPKTWDQALVNDANGLSALAHAAKNGHLAAVELLCEFNARHDVDIVTDVSAMRNYSYNKRKLLLPYASMNINPSDTTFTLAQTLKQKAQSRIDMLYQDDLFDAISPAYSGGRSKAEIDEIIKHIPNINARMYKLSGSEIKYTALHLAVVKGSIGVTTALLKAGAVVDKEILATALVEYYKRDELLAAIGPYVKVDSKHDQNYWGDLLDKLFDHAITHNNTAIIQSLFSSVGEEQKQRALLHSAKTGNTELLNYILDKGVDVNCTTNDGKFKTPAMLAAEHGHIATLQTLMLRGANLQTESEEGLIFGWTALDYAKYYGKTDCAKLLYGALALQKHGNQNFAPLIEVAAYGTINDLLIQLPTTDASKIPIPSADNLKTAILIAQESKQPVAFVKRIQKYMYEHHPETKVGPITALVSLLISPFVYIGKLLIAPFRQATPNNVAMAQVVAPPPQTYSVEPSAPPYDPWQALQDYYPELNKQLTDHFGKRTDDIINKINVAQKLDDKESVAMLKQELEELQIDLAKILNAATEPDTNTFCNIVDEYLAHTTAAAKIMNLNKGRNTIAYSYEEKISDEEEISEIRSGIDSIRQRRPTTRL